jgi:hypothetical protein
MLFANVCQFAFAGSLFPIPFVPRIVTGTLPGDDSELRREEGKGNFQTAGEWKMRQGQLGSLAARRKNSGSW